MTLVIQSGWNGLTDPDAVSYVAAVEAADGEELEHGVAKAINDFVLGCKNDGIWDAIKASCILAGARTLSGALVPLVGTAPTNYNFVAGDYNRETGLVGDGSTKYLSSNRNNNDDPQNNKHVAVTITDAATNVSYYFGDSSLSGSTFGLNLSPTRVRFRLNSSATNDVYPSASVTGLLGFARSNSGNVTARAEGTNISVVDSSASPTSGGLDIFAAGGGAPSNARLAFYSIGESLDLALLDTRVSNLITAIGGAI